MAIAPIPNLNVQIRRKPMLAGEDPVEGAAVFEVAGEMTVCGADPALIAGFTLADKGADLEIDVYEGDLLVAMAHPGSTFWMSGSSAFDMDDQGEDYGIDYSSGVPIVDLTETTTTRLRVETVDLTRDLAEVSVIPANRQFG